MEQAIEIHYRSELKAGLALLEEAHHLLFKRMYSPEDLERNIEDVVDSISPDKLDWALSQVRRTVDKMTIPEEKEVKDE